MENLTQLNDGRGVFKDLLLKFYIGRNKFNDIEGLDLENELNDIINSLSSKKEIEVIEKLSKLIENYHIDFKTQVQNYKKEIDQQRCVAHTFIKKTISDSEKIISNKCNDINKIINNYQKKISDDKIEDSKYMDNLKSEVDKLFNFFKNLSNDINNLSNDINDINDTFRKHKEECLLTITQSEEAIDKFKETQLTFDSELSIKKEDIKKNIKIELIDFVNKIEKKLNEKNDYAINQVNNFNIDIDKMRSKVEIINNNLNKYEDDIKDYIDKRIHKYFQKYEEDIKNKENKDRDISRKKRIGL